MSKFINGLVKFSVATAAVCGVCYLLKDKIKDSSLYTEYKVDDKISKVKDTVKDKMPWSVKEEDIIDDDEIILDVALSTEANRDYVPLDTNDIITIADESPAL